MVSPTPTCTLTLALELADDGVQVSVLGRDVAPADRHLSASAPPPPPGSLRLRLSAVLRGVRLQVGVAPEEAAGLRAPPARRRLPSPPPPAARGASSPPLPPGSCPRRGAEPGLATAMGRGP
jgi:hypothetical protein